MALQFKNGKAVAIGGGKKVVDSFPSLALEELDWGQLKRWALAQGDSRLASIVDAAKAGEARFKQQFSDYLNEHYVRG